MSTIAQPAPIISGIQSLPSAPLTWWNRTPDWTAHSRYTFEGGSGVAGEWSGRVKLAVGGRLFRRPVVLGSAGQKSQVIAAVMANANNNASRNGFGGHAARSSHNSSAGGS
jgi:hypothetical protein